jgi:hypothetical protein
VSQVLSRYAHRDPEARERLARRLLAAGLPA